MKNKNKNKTLKLRGMWLRLPLAALNHLLKTEVKTRTLLFNRDHFENHQIKIYQSLG